MRPCAFVALVPKAPHPSEWPELPHLAALTDGNQAQIALSQAFVRLCNKSGGLAEGSQFHHLQLGLDPSRSSLYSKKP